MFHRDEKAEKVKSKVVLNYYFCREKRREGKFNHQENKINQNESLVIGQWRT